MGLGQKQAKYGLSKLRMVVLKCTQLMADYLSKGYQVSLRDKIGNYHPDLVARKGDEVVVSEE